MSKYKPLERYLRATVGRGRLAMTFSQIERILGAQLPASAKRYPAWWSNEDEGSHVQAHAWRSSGYRTEQVDVVAGKVTFVRDKSATLTASNPQNAPRASHSFFGSMKGTTTVLSGVDLTEPTAPDWGLDGDE